ncbi:MAG: hypothetical protein LC777_08980 [Actinobacteria bacterium]|nr:hypothetical protein [Actinomycetota bacterium]
MNDTPNTTLLVAESDESTRRFLRDNLAADGYLTLGAQTEAETRLKLRQRDPDLLLLGSLCEPHRPLCLLRAIRAGGVGGDPTVPVVALCERGGELELVRAFEAGCDQFMAKPFSYLELRARVNACVSRSQQWRLPRRVVVGALVIDYDERRVSHAANELKLSRVDEHPGIRCRLWPLIVLRLAGSPVRGDTHHLCGFAVAVLAALATTVVVHGISFLRSDSLL